MELNREQIIKELSMFIEDMPADLHLGFARTVKFRDFLEKALALIRELTEENEVLSAELSRYTENVKAMVDAEKAATVRKMQERLKEYFCWDSESISNTAYVRKAIDQIAQELLSDKN